MNFPKVKTDVFLAPMAGVTDVAFRLLCRKYGVGLAFTEMISANALSRGNKATVQLVDVVPEEKPRVVQLFGQNVESLVAAAKICEKKCEILDLNFGCPASKIIKQGAGSALLERPNKIGEIVSAVVGAVSVPVTCKIRGGIRTRTANYVKVAKICEKAGAKMITLHARTQKQGYSGKARWEWIKEVKDSVSILVCGNGDVRTVEDYLEMKKETGCDFVMIGRGAIGNPYLFKQIADFNATGKYDLDWDKQKVFNEYLRLAKKYEVNINNIKFHAQAFTKGVRGGNRLREELVRVKEIKDIEKVMKKI